MARKRVPPVLAAIVLLAFLVPSAATAQPPWPGTPKEAVLVAGPTPSGARLLAFDRGRKLCVSLLERGEPRRWAFPDCERPGGSLREIGLSGQSSGRFVRHYGTVDPAVASVDLVFRRGRSFHVETSAGAAYQGRHAGRVKFLLAEETRRGRDFPGPQYLRLYDQAGTLLGLADAYAFEPGTTGTRRPLARGRTRGAPWSLVAFRARSLAGLPGAEERFVELSCVQVMRRGGRGGAEPFPSRGRARSCVNPERRRLPVELSFDQDCAPLGIAATGIVSPDVRAVVAVLGDGERRRLPLLRLPAPSEGARAFALAVGPRTAVRRLVALMRGGGHRVVQNGIGPGAVRCVDSGALLAFFGLEPPVPSGPLALTVYDDGVELCATLGRPSEHPYECRYPPVGAEDSWILTREEAGRTFTAGIVPADVVRAVVRLSDGRRIVVDTRADGEYTGRYAGALRFFTLDLGDGARVADVRVVDAAGRRTRALYFEAPRPVGRPRLVIGGPRDLRLRAQQYGDERYPYLCVTLGGGECSFGFFESVNVRASCAPRRLVFWGLLTKGQRRVTVETSRGDLRARVRRLPRGLRPPLPARPRWLRRDRPVGAFVVAVPGNTRATALVISGRRDRRQALRLPPASEQCGWSDLLV
jgi:hypothetical protein